MAHSVAIVILHALPIATAYDNVLLGYQFDEWPRLLGDFLAWGGAADFPINGRDGEYPNLSAIAAADSPFAMRACISILPSIANSERLLSFLAISLHLSECRAGRENDSAPAEKKMARLSTRESFAITVVPYARNN